MTTSWLDKKNATKRELLSLIGLFQHATKVVKCGWTFASRMYATYCKQSKWDGLLYQIVIGTSNLIFASSIYICKTPAMGLVFYVCFLPLNPWHSYPDRCIWGMGVWEFLSWQVAAMAMAKRVVIVKHHGKRNGAHCTYLCHVGFWVNQALSLCTVWQFKCCGNSQQLFLMH